MPKRRPTNLGEHGQKKPKSPALGADTQPVDGGAAEPDDSAVEEPGDDAAEEFAVSSSDDESGAGSDLSDDNNDSAEDNEESEYEEGAAVLPAGSRLMHGFQSGELIPVTSAYILRSTHGIISYFEFIWGFSRWQSTNTLAARPRRTKSGR